MFHQNSGILVLGENNYFAIILGASIATYYGGRLTTSRHLIKRNTTATHLICFSQPLIHLFSPRSEVPHTPKSKVTHVLRIPPLPSVATTTPRFNLRPLASYYTLSTLSLTLSLLWFLLLPLWLLLLILLVLLVTLPCVCTVRPHKKTL